MDNLIPEAALEFAVEKIMQANKRLIIIIILLVLALIGTNVAWIIYEAQYVDTVTTTVEQEADNGVNRYIGGDYYGKADCDNN